VWLSVKIDLNFSLFPRCSWERIQELGAMGLHCIQHNELKYGLPRATWKLETMESYGVKSLSNISFM